MNKSNNKAESSGLNVLKQTLLTYLNVNTIKTRCVVSQGGHLEIFKFRKYLNGTEGGYDGTVPASCFSAFQLDGKRLQELTITSPAWHLQLGYVRIRS